MILKAIYLIIISLLVGGCSLFNGNNSPDFNFPSDISTLCYNARDSSRGGIVSKGTSLSTRRGCTVEKVTGQQMFNGYWAWNAGSMWVTGMCIGGTHIQIAVNPSNPVDISMNILMHEFAHYWLITNYDNYTHDALYDDVFFNWQHARNVTGSAVIVHPTNSLINVLTAEIKNRSEGEMFGINYISNGIPVHADVIIIR